MRHSRHFRSIVLRSICLALALPATLLAPGVTPGVQHVAASGPSAVGNVFDGEPNLVQAPDGTLYISALQYVFRSTNGGTSWTQLHPGIYSDSLNSNSDSSIAVDPHGRVYFTFDWPYAGSTAVCTSDDRGDTWSCNPVVVPGGTDRMWIAAPCTEPTPFKPGVLGSCSAFVTTNEGLEQTVLMTSPDAGAHWLPTATTTAGLVPETGALVQAPNGDLMQALNHVDVGVRVWSPAPFPVASDRRSSLAMADALPSMGLSGDGSVYIASEDSNAFGGEDLVISRSTDEGVTWSTPPPLPATTTGTSTFVSVAAGVAGHVGVLYYHSTTAGGPAAVPPSATWDTMFAESFNADTANPTWNTYTLDTNVHSGPVCAAIACSGSGRFAGDFITVMIDHSGTPRATWMRDGGQIEYATAP